MKTLRLSAMQRTTGVIWGLIVTGGAVAAMVALSGYELELVNVVIVALLALGGWLLASALAATRPRKAAAPAAVVENEPLAAEDEPAVVEELTEDTVVDEAAPVEPASDRPKPSTRKPKS